MKRILIFAAALTLAACSAPAEQPKAGAAPAADAQADKAAIDKVREDFAAAFNAGDAAKIGELYAENAVQLPGDQPTINGRAAIVEHNKAMFEQVTAKITLAASHTEISGDMAVDEGTYTMEITPKAPAKGAAAKPTMDEGRYVVVLKRDGGAWKVVTDMDNRSKAPVPAK